VRENSAKERVSESEEARDGDSLARANINKLYMLYLCGAQKKLSHFVKVWAFV